MNELSLHILDLVQNSIAAGALKVVIEIVVQGGWLIITITDDGRGMESELLDRVTSPFATTRKTRKVGLGIPMFKQCAEMCGGMFEITSRPGEGAQIRATFGISHVDRPPMGDLAGTMCALVAGSPDSPEFVLRISARDEVLEFDTREVRAALGGVPLSNPDVLQWIKDYIGEGINAMDAGF